MFDVWDNQVNVNPAYQASELRYALDIAGVKALVVAKTFRNKNLLEILSQLVPELGRNENKQDSTNKTIPTTRPAIPSLEKVIVLSDEPQNRSPFSHLRLLRKNG